MSAIRVLFNTLFLAILILFFSFHFLNTTTGTRWLLKTVAQDHLSFKTVEGSLFNHLILTDVHYDDKTYKIELKKLDLQWSPYALWHQSINIQHLWIDGLKLDLPSNSEKKSFAFKKWYLPLNWELGDLRVQSQNNQLHAQGTLSDHWQFAWKLTIPQLGHWIAGAKGEIFSEGHITGARQTPHLNSNMNAQLLSFHDQYINTLRAQMDVDLTPDGKFNIQAIAHQLLLKHHMIRELQLFAQGITSHHTLNVFINTEDHLHLQLEGGLQAKEWQGHLSQLKWDSNHWHNWQLTQAAPLHISSTQMQVDALCLTSQTQRLCLNARWAPHEKSPLEVQGHISASLRHLALLNQLLPEIRNTNGQFSATFTLMGTPMAPKLTANLLLQAGSTSVPALGLQIHKINAKGSFDDQQNLLFSGTAQSGNGILQFTGKTSLWTEGMPTLLTLKGDAIQIANTRRYQILGSSQSLILKWFQKQLELTGTLLIPKARLSLGDFEQSDSAISDDIVFVNKQTATPIEEDKLPINTKLQVILPNVEITLYGITGTLNGKLLLTRQSNSRLFANGELLLSGKYQAYGQILDIRKGRLIFANSAIDNPGLEIQAVKTLSIPMPTNTSENGLSLTNAADQIGSVMSLTVGVNVQGSANDRQLSLFSEPISLSQSDILSYLLLGRAASEASAADAQLLLKAASSLGHGGIGEQFNRVKQQLQNTFGLSELNVGSSNQFNPSANTYTKNTSLILGKWLSPKLYLNYSIGFLQPVNVLKLRYYFLNTKQWFLQTESSSLANGVDAFYTFER